MARCLSVMKPFGQQHEATVVANDDGATDFQQFLSAVVSTGTLR